MKKVLFAMSTATALLFSCSKPAESLACFNTSTIKAEVNEEITFTNCSLENFQNVWTFGDGTTSTNKDEKHKYTKAGYYTVNLTTYAEKGNQPNSIQQGIQVINPNEKFDNYLAGNLTTTLPNGSSTIKFWSYFLQKSNINNNIVYVNTFLNDINTTKNIIGTVSGNSISVANMDSLRCNNINSNVFMDGSARANLRDFTATLDPAAKKLNITFTLSVFGAFDATKNGNHKYSFTTAE